MAVLLAISSGFGCTGGGTPDAGIADSGSADGGALDAPGDAGMGLEGGLDAAPDAEVGADAEAGTEAGAVPDATMAHVELGSGGNEFRPLSRADAELEIHRGFQGGYHVFGSVRFTGVEQEQLEGALVRYELADPGTDTLFAGPRDVTLSEMSVVRMDGTWVHVGDLVIFNEDPTSLVGETARFRVEVTLPGGARLADAHTVTLVDEL